MMRVVAFIDQPWAKRALCAQTDPEMFFPEKGGSTRDAKKVCVACDVRGECLEYAIQHGERFGIWGGLTEHQRRTLRNGTTITCCECGTLFYGPGGYASHQRGHARAAS